MWTEIFEIVSRESCINPIVLGIVHNLHSDKLLVGSNEDFVCGTLHLLLYFLPSAKPFFFLDARGRTCFPWIQYVFTPQFSFTIRFIRLFEISRCRYLPSLTWSKTNLCLWCYWDNYAVHAIAIGGGSSPNKYK